MQICLVCKKEMRCVKTGIVVVFGGDHCYAGDAFRCDNCGSEVAVTSPQPHHDPNALLRGAINMDNWPNQKS